MKHTLLYFPFLFLTIFACKPDHKEEARELWFSSNNISAIRGSSEIGRNQFRNNILQTDYLIAEMERQKDSMPETDYLRMKEELGTIRSTFERLSAAYFHATKDEEIDAIQNGYDVLEYDINKEDLDLERFKSELMKLERQTTPIREKLMAIVTESDVIFGRLDSVREKLHAEWKTPS